MILKQKKNFFFFGFCVRKFCAPVALTTAILVAKKKSQKNHEIPRHMEVYGHIKHIEKNRKNFLTFKMVKK